MLNLRNLILRSYKLRLNERKILEIRRGKILNILNKISKRENKEEIIPIKIKIREKIKNFDEFKNDINENRIKYVDFMKYGITQNEKRQINKWTKLKMKEVIFDSDINNCKSGKSDFDSRIMYYSNIIILIETINGIKFGGYISKRIVKYGWIYDEESFLFSFYGNKNLNFPIKNNFTGNTFKYCNKKERELFKFGNNEIVIYKKGLRLDIMNWNNNYNSYKYSYGSYELIGRTGENCVSIRRILVISMN